MTLYIASDIDERVLVWLFTGPDNSDADYEAYCESILQFDRVAAGKDGAAVLIADPGNPTRGSAWRKKIADVSTSLKSKPAFVMVSSSPLLRGVMTAINWIRPPSYPCKAVATLDDAEAWLTSTLKHPLPTLRKLVAEVRAKSHTLAR